MANMFLILQLVAVFTVVSLSLLGSFFIVFANLIEFQSSRVLQTGDLIITCLALSNGLTDVGQVPWFLVYILNLCNNTGEDLYKATDFFITFYNKASSWFTAWLCLFYCVKIVKVNWRTFLKLKRRISSVVKVLIAVTLVGCLALSLPIIFFIQLQSNTSSISAQCKNYYINENSFYVYAAFLSFFTSFLPLAIMLASSMTIVTFLCKHSRKMNKSTNAISGSRGDGPAAVAKMITSLIVLYVLCTGTVFALNSLVVLEGNVLVFIALSCSVYSAGCAMILIIGTVKLKEKCKGVCCRGNRTEKPKHAVTAASVNREL
ncbi:taste receptor type 2 member 1-like [Latimeria chalumnae]|nr:PREDICTED: taste receptor type 2 member 1-like [Latimeria chalumnae]|eukprot:XP_006012473.1 PREDICTED: taste receptor type 2 member 1-like [Latimeria chalumnae]